jgi:O-acetyl-ADP-ribose deacetylase (regulator of RNase III)
MQDQIELAIGSIAEGEVDIVVNSANTDLIMGDGVAAAILAEAGPEVEEEAMEHAPTGVGDVVVTSAGSLDARWIIHVVVVGETEPDLYECTRRVLEEATELKAETIAFPALGTGSAGIEPEVAAESMMQALRDYLQETRSDIEVRIVLWDEDMYPIFQEALDEAVGEIEA